MFALKQTTIIDKWIAAVKLNRTIESTDDLTYSAILDSLPKLLNTIQHLLSQSTAKDIEDLKKDGQVHGEARARQGYDAEEIVREYAILRNVIFDELEESLLKNTALLQLRTIRLVDGAIDRVMAVAMKRYTEERLQAVNLLYDELVASNQELDWLVRNEQTNLAALAHELKTPLSSIIGYSDLFLRQHAKAETHPRYIEQVLAGGRRLLEMINEALEMSTYEAGKVRLTLEPVQTCDVVEEVSLVLEMLAQQKGLTLSIDRLSVDRPIVTDKKRLRQIVTNLISNAIRYTEVGHIRVGVRLVMGADTPDVEGHSPIESHSDGEPSEGADAEHMEITHEMASAQREESPLERRIRLDKSKHELSESLHDRIEIAVTDTGLGIDPAEQVQIFKPYYQGKAGQQLACSTGLGLAITYQMVKLLQGSIHLKSEPGSGSTFTIALPLQYKSDDPTAVSAQQAVYR